MNRKLFWLFTAILLVLIHRAEAQQPPKIPHVGILNAVNAPASREALVQGLRELGYVEGKNIVIDYRSADGHLERFPSWSGSRWT
jgi:putative ABC transport system substrate-binding protein